MEMYKIDTRHLFVIFFPGIILPWNYDTSGTQNQLNQVRNHSSLQKLRRKAFEPSQVELGASKPSIVKKL